MSFELFFDRSREGSCRSFGKYPRGKVRVPWYVGGAGKCHFRGTFSKKLWNYGYHFQAFADLRVLF